MSSRRGEDFLRVINGMSVDELEWAVGVLQGRLQVLQDVDDV